MQITKEFLDNQIAIAQRDYELAQNRVFEAIEAAGRMRGILETAQHMRAMLDAKETEANVDSKGACRDQARK